MDLKLHSRPQEESTESFSESTDNEASVHSPQSKDGCYIKSKLARRVKVYYLLGEDWLDNGTGYCMGEVDSETKKPYFVVRNELDSENVILKSFLEGSIQYQRQQETLIVWTDLAGKDLALSFQENEGCADLCEFIVKVQQENLSPMISLYYVLTTMQNSSEGPREVTELIAGPITYPPSVPSTENLGEVLETISQCSNSNYTRAKILEFFLREEYHQSLFRVFVSAEKEKHLESLHLLSDIFKVILSYNDPDLIEEFVKTERNVIGIAGIFEYDREFPRFKACHREYLLDESKFKTVVDIPEFRPNPESDMSMFRKDFVLNYLKDVVLARILEEQVISILSSLIYKNQLDIICFMADSEASDQFLRRLFMLYDEGKGIEVQRKRDGVKMLHQYVLVAKNHQATQIPEFFVCLVKSGLFEMIKFALKDSRSETRVGGTEILVSIIEQDVSLINTATRGEYAIEINDAESAPVTERGDAETTSASPLLKHNLVSDMSTTIVLCQLLLEDKNPGLKIQAFEALKMLLSSSCEDAGLEILQQDKLCTEEHYAPGVKQYYEAFYQEVAPMLFADFIELASDDEKLWGRVTACISNDPILYQHLCDLLSFLLREHDFMMFKGFLYGTKILKGMVRVLAFNAKVILKLGVIRCLKSFLLLNDQGLSQFVIHNNLLQCFFEFFKSVAAVNNLANSLCIDLLETIVKRGKDKNFRLLLIHVYQLEREFLLNDISYVSTGHDLVHVAEVYLEGTKDATATSVDADEDVFVATNLSLPIQTGMEETRPPEVDAPTNIFENIQNEFSGKRLHSVTCELEPVQDSKCHTPPEEPSSPRKKKTAMAFEQKPLETTASV